MFYQLDLIILISFSNEIFKARYGIFLRIIFFIENDIMFCTFYHFIFHIYLNPYKIKTLESSKKFFDQLMVELSYKVSKIFGL